MCPACRGSGEVEHCHPSMDPAPCRVCRGNGVVLSFRPHNGIAFPLEKVTLTEEVQRQMDAIKETLDDAGL